MNAEPSLTARAVAALRWLGLPGIVLLAALLTDLAVIIPAAFDSIGPKCVDLYALPGVLAISACALWARERPALAAFAGAAVLVASSGLISLTHAPLYTTVLPNVSFAETVAGCELVYYVARRVQSGVAFSAISSLVVGCLWAVLGRGPRSYSLGGNRFLESLVFGLLLLGAAVAFGVHARKPEPSSAEPSALVTLAREQWPLIGGLCLFLFFEVASAFDVGPPAFPVLFCSIAASVAAVYSARNPVRGAVATAAALGLSAVITPFVHLPLRYPLAPGMPITQIIAGSIVVVFLIRRTDWRVAWTNITVLSAVVAFAVVVNYDRPGPHLTLNPRLLQPLIIFAALLLGIEVAIGLFLRSRDSERTQVVKSAVTDAQTSERMALARELHDVVAHHVTGIVVQAQAAAMMGEKNPQVAIEALGRIENAGTEALAAMRRLVRSMRGDAPAGTTDLTEQATTDLAADLRKLVDGSNHGVPTRLDLKLPGHLPQEVGRSALRLVQESLTNVGKHATGAQLVTVLAELSGPELHLRVSDDGRGGNQRPAGGSGGYGLVGMRERVALLHGRLDAGRGPLGGWRVEAWLPLEGEE